MRSPRFTVLSGLALGLALISAAPAEADTFHAEKAAHLNG
jgi:hypothetical protein